MSLGGALPGKEDPSSPYREDRGIADSAKPQKLYALTYGWKCTDTVYFQLDRHLGTRHIYPDYFFLVSIAEISKINDTCIYVIFSLFFLTFVNIFLFLDIFVVFAVESPFFIKWSLNVCLCV